MESNVRLRFKSRDIHSGDGSNFLLHKCFLSLQAYYVLLHELKPPSPARPFFSSYRIFSAVNYYVNCEVAVC